MSENELKSEVLKEVEDSGMQASDEDLTIIVGNVVIRILNCQRYSKKSLK